MGSSLRKKLSAVLLAATAGLVFAGNTAKANDTKKRIVILGDSITAGYGLDLSQAYPALIQQKLAQAKLPFIIVNAGVSGDTTAGGLRRVAWALSKGADVLIIALGGNDGLRGISPNETKKNLLGIVKKARLKYPAIKTIIAGMQMPDNMGSEFTERFKKLFPQIATASNSYLIPFLIEGVGGDENLNQADGIHPTAEGQKVVAQNVWKILLPLITKKEI
ncbi:MAG: arylesterase [Akkermansiaceae bacterium]|nr:arylesterase [Akkermansiaceae bacterium]